MKRCALFVAVAFVILSVSCAWGGVSLSAFPDPVFRKELKRYDSGWIEYDSNGNAIRDAYGNTIYFGKDNGILDDKEIEGITSLSFVGYGYNNDGELTSLELTSLEGIKYLTSLEHLFCIGTNLTTLDLSGCTSLKTLYCSNNYYDHEMIYNYLSYTGHFNPQLTIIDVSGCTALQTLNCHNNHLTTLNANGCTSLQSLYCFNNQLTTLNVSGCTSLKSLGCDNNQLTTLNVDGCTSLQGLRCGSNQLTTLNVSGCTPLQKLYCWNNQLAELNVNGCTSLQYLYCYDNQLTTLDLSGCTSLQDLYCFNNQLTTLNVSGCTSLQSLSCSINQLTELDLGGFASLEYLGCNRNQLMTLNVNGCTSLQRLYCNDNQLTELDLSDCTALDPYCLDISSQKAKGLKVKKISLGRYEINMKDYVSNLDNIFDDAVHDVYHNDLIISYDKETGIAVLKWPVAGINYFYDVGISGYSISMHVTVTNALSFTALGHIISDITDNSYQRNGFQLTESDIGSYIWNHYAKLGLTADGNSRLILCVQTDKPGTVSFSFNDDIGAKLESIYRYELSASDKLNTTEIYSDIHQVSAVLVAPENFPKNKNFPSDTFSVHVKFTDEDGKITEDDLELKIEAAPVILIPGRMNMSFLGAILNPSDANNTFGVKSKTGIYGELLKIGFKEEHIAALDYWVMNTYRLSNYLSDMFDSYDDEGIVCTKADVVAHGLGGLIVRKFLDGLSDEYNYKYRSYKQPPIRRVVNIAVPHRGSPLANVMLGDMSVINDDLPLGTDRLAYRYLKYFPSTFTAIFNGASKAGWEDLAVGSEVTSLPFPAKVPMHFIYGDVTHSLDTLENMKDLLFLAFNVYKLIKAVGPSIAKYQDLTSYLEDLGILKEFAHLQGKYLDNFQLLEALAMLDKEVLRVMAEQKDIITGLVREVMEKFGIPFAQMASNSPTFTGLIQIGSVAMGGAAGLLTTPIDLFFVIQRLIFSGQPHDTFVPKWSATAAFPEYSTGFPITPGIFDFWHFKYGEICHQNDVAEFVGYLLKDAPLSKFSVLEESLPLPGSVSAKTSSNGDSDSDIDIDFENFYVKNFSLAIRKSTRENFGEGMTALKFIAETTIKTSNDVKLVVQKDSLDRIFPMFSENGLRFESVLVFSSSDEGAMTAYCYAPSGKGNLYISDTVNVDVSAAIDEDTQEELPPEILTETLTNAITNQSYSLQLTASGTTPITWTHTGKLPAGLSLSESGLISGTPARAGKSSFTVTAQNSFGKTSRPFTLQTFDPVTITTASLKAGTIGKSYSVTMRAKGSKTITWSAEGLPNGLSINAKGKISGKPSAYGKFTVKIAAQNGAGSITKSLQLEIKAIAPTLSGTLAKPTLNVPYSSGLKLSKGSTPITWSVQGNLPGGLTLDSSTGIISGTPTSYDKSGYKVTITASNDAGIKSKKITLKVKGTVPKIKTSKLAEATAGQAYSMTLETSAGNEPIEWSASGLPSGLGLDGDTITGTPSTEGTYTVKITAANPVKDVSKTLKLKVNKAANTRLPSERMTPENKNTSNTSQAHNDGYTDDEKYSYSESYVIVAELGVISSDEEGMHEFGVALPDSIPEGLELVYIANSDEPSEDDEIAEFYDDEGNEISKVPESRKITVSIWLNPERVYNPAIGIKR